MCMQHDNAIVLCTFYLEYLELQHPGAVGTMPISLKLLIG